MMNESHDRKYEDLSESAGPALVPQTFAPQTGWKRSRRGIGLVALALCCSLLGGAVGAGGMAYLNGSQGTGGQATVMTAVAQGAELTTVSSVSNAVLTDSRQELSYSEIYEGNVNSVVGITTSITTTNSFGFTTEAAASGTGFILTEDGYILTNQHVIEDANSITVTMYDGTSYTADLIGFDESNDIAVLKVDDAELKPVTLGDSDSLKVGDSVSAIGNPLGELTFSLTHGVISALDREVTLSSKTTMELIQTDCAINSGNSGGPLFNAYGEVIGITNAKYSSNSSGEASIDNIGFAIPINSILDIVESIIDNGYILKPYIGVSISNVSSEMTRYGLPKGVVVNSVAEDSPAADAGLKANDIITKVNGTAVTDSSAFTRTIQKSAEGSKLTLTVYRQGNTLELTVTVVEKEQSALGETAEETQTTTSQKSPQNSFPWGFGYSIK